MPQLTNLCDFCGQNDHFICADWYYDDQKCAQLNIGGENIKNYQKLVGDDFYTLFGMKNTIIKASVDQFL